MSETSAPIRVNVTPAEEIYGGVDHPDIYRNESTPRGFAFIANMFSFVNDVYELREGSDVDVRNLKELFTQMGYLVEEHHDLSEPKLRNALTTLSEDPRLAIIDSLVVIIMSHGTGGEMGQSHVFTADGRSIEDKDIYDYFNNQNCPHLQGKPKICIFQCCRGDLPDIGVEPVAQHSNVYQGRDVARDGAALRETHSIQNLGTYSDFFVIYSTVQGFVAYRDYDEGSWLIQSLCQEFMKHAHNTELDVLVKKVSRCVSARQSSEGRKQVVEIRNLGVDKKFYFNPVHINQLNAPIRVNVTPAEEIYGGVDHPDIYRNESTPRGFAFIANMDSFVNDVHGQREGSQVDVRNLKELFTQMGYLVEEHHDLSEPELRNALKTLSEDPRLATIDSLVVIVMGHGTGGEMGQSHVFTADGRTIDDKDISDYFHNQNCQHLQGKPKICIFHFYSGDLPDIGVEPAPPPVAQHSNVSQDRDVARDGAVLRETHSIHNRGTYSDFYVIYLPGFVAYWDNNKGSWPIESLCQEFMEHAHNTDLDALVRKLSRCVSARQSSEGRKLVVETRHFGFHKQFYFNPVHINELQLAQRGLVTLAKEDFQDGDSFKSDVVRRVRGRENVFWFNDDIKEKRLYERRYGKLTAEDKYLGLHSLSHWRRDIGQGVTVIRDLVPSHYDGIDSFLLLAADPAGPQIKIRVRLQPLHRLTANFVRLCTGIRGPSYKGAKVEDIRWKNYKSDLSCLFSVNNYIENGREKKGAIETISRGVERRDCEPGEVVLWGWDEGSFWMGEITSRFSDPDMVGVVTSPSVSDLESFKFEGSQIKIIDCGICVPI